MSAVCQYTGVLCVAVPMPGTIYCVVHNPDRPLQPWAWAYLSWVNSPPLEPNVLLLDDDDEEFDVDDDDDDFEDDDHDPEDDLFEDDGPDDGPG